MLMTKKAAALRYSQGEDDAPKLVAKGKGFIAEKIIEVAKEHNIPIHEDANLVHVLEKMDLNTEIPQELYRAVAEVLALVYRLNADQES